jgi:kinesin family protein 2/24
MREDGRQQVCIVGLQEFEVSDVQIVKEFIEKGNAARSTGSTGANEESSRSHAILQLVVKRHNDVIKESRRNNDGNETKSGKVVGKISFIDLAGSERGADTTDNDRQTRYFFIVLSALQKLTACMGSSKHVLCMLRFLFITLFYQFL